MLTSNYEFLYIGNKRHLGDVLTIMNIIYNRKYQTEVKIFGPKFILEILDQLKYDFVYSGGTSNNIEFHDSIANFYGKGQNLQVPFLIGKHFTYKKHAKNQIKEHYNLPKYKKSSPQKTENLVFFQLDSRTHHMQKYNVDYSQIIKNHTTEKNKIKGIGGKETKKYLPSFDYELGNLADISKNLLKASCFLGIDSGIAHLAGTLQVPGYMFINHTKFDEELKNFYNLLYPSLITPDISFFLKEQKS